MTQRNKKDIYYDLNYYKSKYDSIRKYEKIYAFIGWIYVFVNDAMWQKEIYHMITLILKENINPLEKICKCEN